MHIGLKVDVLSQQQTASAFPADIFRLDNGLTVIHQYIPATPVAVVDVWVKAGAAKEPAHWSGMAHFLEHMIFKGTALVAPGEFDQVVENTGGMTNAATSHDYAHFFITTAVPYLQETLPYLAELLLAAGIPDDEFDRERDVVLEEIRGAYDNPDWLGFQALLENVYQQHPYGRPVLGTEELLLQYTPEVMRHFHACHYQPENMTVVVVGGVSQTAALELVSQSFQKFQTRREHPKLVAEAEPPIAEIRRQELLLPRLEQARLMMAWTGSGVEDLKSAYGLDLLSVLLAEGRSSRLVRELREEKQLVHGISSSFSLQQDSSLFTITAHLEPKYLEEVEKIICDRLHQLQFQPPTPVELARCQRVLCNDYAFSTEAPCQLAGLYGYYNTIADANLAVTYPQQIQALYPSDVQRLMQQYISSERYAVTVLKPFDS